MLSVPPSAIAVKKPCVIGANIHLRVGLIRWPHRDGALAFYIAAASHRCAILAKNHRVVTTTRNLPSKANKQVALAVIIVARGRHAAIGSHESTVVITTR